MRKDARKTRPLRIPTEGRQTGHVCPGVRVTPDELRSLVTNDAMTDREDRMRTVPRGPIVAHVLTKFAGTS
jgi:hypothetical protein